MIGGNGNRQTLRDWVRRVQTRRGRRWAAGATGLSGPVLASFGSGKKGRARQDAVEPGPDREVDGAVRWRRNSIFKRVIAERFGVALLRARRGNASQRTRLLAHLGAAAQPSGPGCRDDRSL